MSNDSCIDSIMNNDLNDGCSIEADKEIIDSGLAYADAFITCIAIAEAFHNEGNTTFVKMFLPGAVEPTFGTEGHTFDLITGQCSCGEFEPKILREHRKQ